jgi:hypothetical protein
MREEAEMSGHHGRREITNFSLLANHTGNRFSSPGEDNRSNLEKKSIDLKCVDSRTKQTFSDKIFNGAILIF